MNEALNSLAEYIVAAQSQAVVSHEITHGELSFTVHRGQAHAFIKFLKNDTRCSFQQLVDLCGADYPEREARFDVVYNFLSLKFNRRIRVKTAAKENEQVDSVTDLYSSAGWFEREAFDLYGIVFANSPDLRRILTDYGFLGHPLRKDFPLTGFVELRYDLDKKRIVSESVKLPQDYRSFDFTSPWEGMTTVQLAGDEKAVKQKVGAK